MRIAVVTPHYPPLTGGIAESVSTIVGELVRRGHEVRVYGPSRAIWIAGVPIFIPRVGREFDAIYCHGLEFPSSLACVRGRGLLHIHTYYPDCGIFESRVRKLGCRAQKLVRSLYDRKVVVAEWLLDLFPDASVVRPLVRLPEPVGSSRGDYLLFVGKTAKEKGFDDFVRLVRATGIRGVVVGGGADRRSEISRARGVEVLGWLPREDALRWMSRAMALVITSRWEGFPLAAAEAAAMKVPVIARDIPGTREVLGDNAYFCTGLKDFIDSVRRVARGELPDLDAARERVLRLMDFDENIGTLIEELRGISRLSG